MRLERLGSQLLRYALAGILIYLGACKLTTVEAHAIQPLLAHSPLFGWAYTWLSVQAVSNLIGLTEMVLGGLIAMRRPFPRLAALGSLGAIGVFTAAWSAGEAWRAATPPSER